MNPFSALAKRNALRKYARDLPGQLYKDYGAAEFFTPAQIAASVKRLKLNPAWIAYANAMFLPRVDFDLLFSRKDNPPSYNELRSAFLRHVPSGKKPSHGSDLFGSDNGAGVNLGTGYLDGGGGGHGGGHGF